MLYLDFCRRIFLPHSSSASQRHSFTRSSNVSINLSRFIRSRSSAIVYPSLLRSVGARWNQAFAQRLTPKYCKLREKRDPLRHSDLFSFIDSV